MKRVPLFSFQFVRLDELEEHAGTFLLMVCNGWSAANLIASLQRMLFDAYIESCL